MRLVLDHSIVGQSATTLTIRKDRRYAGCSICGDLFQPRILIEKIELSQQDVMDAEYEIADWRMKHNRKHSAKEHMQHAESGLTFQPEAAHRLAPFGLVPVGDAEVDEIEQALREAPRAPTDDVETTNKGWR